MRIRSVQMSQNGEQPTKKSYATPTLIAYGDVRKITETVGGHGAGDGGFGMHNKTAA